MSPTSAAPPDALSVAASPHGRLGYPAAAGTRDLRFDMLRGLAMLTVVASHFEAFSWFNFLFWERLGFIAGVEMFVITSGLVLGLVNRRVADRDGIGAVSERLLRRSFVLWRAQVAVILLVILLARLDAFDMKALTTFTDRFAGATWPMIPPADMPWHQQLALAALLRVSPHQIQVLSLYVVLLALAPLAFWLLQRRLVGPYLALSWVLYAAGWLSPPDRLLLGMQFEYAFPVLMYQVLFTHALAAGFFRGEIAAWLAARPDARRALVALAAGLALFFLVLAQATPNPSFPAWSHLDLVTAERFQAFYDLWLVKDRPGLARLLNAAALFVSLFALLTWFWRPIHRALGWLLIPLGEASLYVFLMHLLFIALIDQIPGYFDGIPAWDEAWPIRIWINSALYAGTILGLWLLVRHRVLFGIVPR